MIHVKLVRPHLSPDKTQKNKVSFFSMACSVPRELALAPCGKKGLGLCSPYISMFCIFCISMFSWILVHFLDHSRNAFCLCRWLSARLSIV